MAYEYDGHGRQVSRTDGGVRSDFWYDVRGMTYKTGASTSTYNRTPGGALLSIGRSGSVWDYARDRLGSVRNVVSTTQTLSRTLSYDPWGSTNIDSGTPYSGPRWTGVYQDDTTGLYRMDARFYQPGRGRFTQVDPLPKSIIAVNRYAYTSCNPVNATDPSGLSHCNSFMFTVAIIAVIAGLAVLGIVVSAIPATASFAVWVVAVFS